jgi:uncharacterized protein (TIGR03032 family)
VSDSAPDSPAAAAQPLRSSYSTGFAALVERLGGALAVSTYAGDRVLLLRAAGDALDVHIARYPRPMGLAATPGGLAFAAGPSVWRCRDQPAAAAAGARRADAVYVPALQHRTGDLRTHELAWGEAGLWLVATRFNCLATLDTEHSFVPRWQPRFVPRADENDACHLNGVALRDGVPRWVTALAPTAQAGGWRARRFDGGVLIDVVDDRLVAEGLCMPHSPRWHRSRLYLLESGRGTLLQLDPAAGRPVAVAQLPGFARGLALVGDVAFVGLSRVREAACFGGLPITAEGAPPRECGIWALDLRDGRVLGFARFDGGVDEIFDVQWLAGTRWPELLEPDAPAALDAFALPAAALARFGA